MQKLQQLFIQEQIIIAIRKFFSEKGFHEVITPVLNQALPLEPNIYAFKTDWNTTKGKTSLYLQTSPESYLKKLLALGVGNCFSISKSFRNLESSGTRHNPEFLMLEWYRENADYFDIIKDTQDLILSIKHHIDSYQNQNSSTILEYQIQQIELKTPWPILSLVDLISQYSNLQIENILDDSKLFEVAKQKGYDIKNTTWGALFDQIFLNEIEPHLPITPIFLTDFPSKTSPLCTPRNDKPYLAQRFELYIANIELANGNTENTDTKTIIKVFEQENNFRQKNKILAPPIDQSFLTSLEKIKDKSYAGIGVGIDRLTMLFSNQANIIDNLV